MRTRPHGAGELLLRSWWRFFALVSAVLFLSVDECFAKKNIEADIQAGRVLLATTAASGTKRSKHRWRQLASQMDVKPEQASPGSLTEEKARRKAAKEEARRIAEEEEQSKGEEAKRKAVEDEARRKAAEEEGGESSKGGFSYSIKKNLTDDEGFDCEAGKARWERGWSEMKKEWCCQHENFACPGGESSKGGSIDSQLAEEDKANKPGMFSKGLGAIGSAIGNATSGIKNGIASMTAKTPQESEDFRRNPGKFVRNRQARKNAEVSWVLDTKRDSNTAAEIHEMLRRKILGLTDDVHMKKIKAGEAMDPMYKIEPDACTILFASRGSSIDDTPSELLSGQCSAHHLGAQDHEGWKCRNKLVMLKKLQANLKGGNGLYTPRIEYWFSRCGSPKNQDGVFAPVLGCKDPMQNTTAFLDSLSPEQLGDKAEMRKQIQSNWYTQSEGKRFTGVDPTIEEDERRPPCRLLECPEGKAKVGETCAKITGGAGECDGAYREKTPFKWSTSEGSILWKCQYVTGPIESCTESEPGEHKVSEGVNAPYKFNYAKGGSQGRAGSACFLPRGSGA